MFARFWRSVAAVSANRYKLVVLLVALVTIVLAAGAPRLRFDTSQDALIGKDTTVARENRQYQRAFGGETMLVLYTAKPGRTVADLVRGRNRAAFHAIAAELHRSGQVAAVISPATAAEFAKRQSDPAFAPKVFDAAKADFPDRAGELDRTLQTETERLLAAGEASLDNPKYVDFLLHTADGKVRSALSSNFIDDRHGLMVVYLKGNLAIGDMGKGVDAVRSAVERHPVEGFEPLTTGAPVLLTDINDYLRGGITQLGGLAVAVMLVVLWLVFRRRWRLLSLGLVAVGMVGTFGFMGWVGIPLTLVTISGLPILIGMGVDFAVQMHSRFEEEVDVDRDLGGVLSRVLAHLGPALAVALIAAMLGFVALQLSRVPLIRQFGVMLDLGVAVMFLTVIFLPLALLSWRERARPTPPDRHLRHGVGLEKVVGALAFVGRRWLAPVAVIGVIVVVAGFAVEGRFTIQTDPEKWIPQDGATVHSLEDLRAGTGYSTFLGLMVQAPDTTATPVATWMQRFAETEAEKHSREIVHFSSFGDVVTTLTGAPPSKGQIDLLLPIAPPDVRNTFLSTDHTKANLVFPIANISLTQRGKLLDAMTSDLETGDLKPPPGVSVTPSGLVVVGVALVDALQANRVAMTFVALGLVAVWLLIFFRRFTKMVLTLIPVLISVGLSSLVVYATGLELSPLTAVSGPLVIAVCTEFAVLIMSRYVEERERGRTPEMAVREGAVRIGRAYVASGFTLIGGFAVIATSAFPLLRDFGIIVALNVVVALVCALVVLPPILMWADEHPRISGFEPGGEGFGGRHVHEPEPAGGVEPEGADRA